MRQLLLLVGLVALPALAADLPPGLRACRLDGVEHGAWCGVEPRPLDPTRPDGVKIDIHFAVLPALARNKKPDPVFFLAGGPGQSAIDLAGSVGQLLARFGNRRDIVLVDQRGTGRSAPLRCADEPPTRPLRELADPALQQRELSDCLAALQRLPYGDLRQFTTTIAMQDLDAVRRRLGAERIDLVGGSYGTRAALEYLRQFPQAVRRVVLDGVAPPDMVLPESFGVDAQAAFEGLLAACEGEAACARRFPQLRRQWQALLASLPRDVSVQQPVTRTDEKIRITRETLLGLVRLPLYVPALASALPLALAEASEGRFTALFGLGGAMGGGIRLALGMHFSVVCAEDYPRLPALPAAAGDFGDDFASTYRRACPDWPRGRVPDGFYQVSPAPVAVLLLSGAADPATPPRHAERVAQALGARARSVVVPNAGHGVLSVPCLRDTVFRFVEAESDAEALQVDVGCAAAVPRPPAFLPVVAGASK